MKRIFCYFAMALLASAMFTACGGDDKGTEGPPPPPPTGIDGVTVVDKLSGSVKAGVADAIEITGSGFDPSQDWVFIGYDENGKTTYVRITTDVLTMKSGRIAFGVPITAGYLDKTFKVYLDRQNTKMELTEDLTFTMPTVADGYIPDPDFRATLANPGKDEGNPEISVLFNSYGLLDVAAAAALKQGCAAGGYALNLYNCKAKSLEGIELFKSLQGTIAAWLMPEIEVMDLSKWEAAKSVGYFAFFATDAGGGLPKLKKFIGGPGLYALQLTGAPNLEYCDLSRSKWLYNAQVYSSTEKDYIYDNLTYLDIRKNRLGTEFGGPVENSAEHNWKGYPNSADDNPTGIDAWVPFVGKVWFGLADNAHILVDYQFLIDKYSYDSNKGYDGKTYGYMTIYDAWKRGATIDVYSSKDNAKKLGTVPMYKDDANALGACGVDNGWVPDAIE